jgi:hypothetical protein
VNANPSPRTTDSADDLALLDQWRNYSVERQQVAQIVQMYSLLEELRLAVSQKYIRDAI